MLPTYAPSGKYTSSFLTLAPAAIALGAVLGAVYQFGIHYIGFVKINLALWLFAGFAAGGIAGAAMRLSKCRHAMLGAFMGGLVGLATTLAGHAVEYWLQTSSAGVSVSFADYVEVRVRSGWTINSRHSSSPASAFTSSRPDISGTGVWVVWGVEAAGLILTGALTARAMVRKPFCEACTQWVGRPRVAFAVPWVPPDAAARAKAAATLEDLLSIAPQPPSPPVPMPIAKATPDHPAPPVGTTFTRLQYTLTACPTCDDTNILAVDVLTTKQVRAKQVAETKASVRTNILLNKADADKVLAAAAAWQAAKV